MSGDGREAGQAPLSSCLAWKPRLWPHGDNWSQRPGLTLSPEAAWGPLAHGGVQHRPVNYGESSLSSSAEPPATCSCQAPATWLVWLETRVSALFVSTYLKSELVAWGSRPVWGTRVWSET